MCLKILPKNKTKKKVHIKLKKNKITKVAKFFLYNLYKLAVSIAA